MELEFDRGQRQITLAGTKALTKLDRMAIGFSECLSKNSVNHVIVSGYVAILFGRSRGSEDIDFICEPMTYDRFSTVWDDIHTGFECIITADKQFGFEGYLLAQTAIRFAFPGEFIPNIELKFAQTDLQHRALAERFIVRFNGYTLPISPLEQQIAFKLYLGSDKDIEDARFLFRLFEDNLDKGILGSYFKTLHLSFSMVQKYLGWTE